MKHVGILIIFAAVSIAQTRVDPQLAAEIDKIKAIDNHAHPVLPALSDSVKDTEFDALPVDSMEAYTEPVRTREGSPLVIEAWRQLFGYQHNDRDPEHVRELR